MLYHGSRLLALVTASASLLSVSALAEPSRRAVDRRVLSANASEPVTYSLVDADSLEGITGFDPIPDQAEIILEDLPSKRITIRANISSVKGRQVAFLINGRRRRVDSLAPYTLSNRSGWSPRDGSYKLDVDVSARRGRARAAMLARDDGLTVRIARKRGRASPTPTPIADPTPIATPSPSPTSTPQPTPSATPSPSPTASPTPAPSPFTPPPAPPMLSQYLQQLNTFGTMHCEMQRGTSANFDTKLLGTYYDAMWVYYQLFDYTGNGYWITCANAARAVYRDQYVLPNNGVVPGFWNFTHGLAEDFLRYGNVSSRQAAIALSQNAAFARDSTATNETVDDLVSRETAYAIMAYLNAEDLGQPRRARLSLLVNHALGHIDQWFVSRTADYMRPFMFSLTAHALISYYERTGDSRVIPALVNAADSVWSSCWLPQAQAFKYTDRNTSSGGEEPAPDLNMLIAPIYAALYHYTGQSRFLTRADAIFQGGVVNAYLYNAKQFNQNYRLLGDFMRWRNSPPSVQ